MGHISAANTSQSCPVWTQVKDSGMKIGGEVCKYNKIWEGLEAFVEGWLYLVVAWLSVGVEGAAGRQNQ